MVLKVDEVYLNGAYVPLGDARVPVMDRGFLFGDGVYEVIPVYGGRLFCLERHLDRLDRSLKAIRMENPLPRLEWARVLKRVTRSETGTDQLAYLQVTRGVDPARNHLFPVGAGPTVLAMAWNARPRNPEISAKGISVITSTDIRWLRCDIKATALLSNVLLRQAAQDAGAEEAILIRDGFATEGSSTNFILVKDGVLVTPPESNLLLPGITRGLVLELALGAGIPCFERAVSEAELESADEIWIVSSSREVVPVTRLNGSPVGSGSPGPAWRRMDTLFQEYKAGLQGTS